MVVVPRTSARAGLKAENIAGMIARKKGIAIIARKDLISYVRFMRHGNLHLEYCRAASE
jgi:hypothetical protein